MFAFAIFDRPRRRVMLARDRVGKKPLYYGILRQGAPEESLVFASELKSLLADPDFPRDIEPLAINHYLTYQYVPAPWSIFKEARKLPPAHWLLYENGSTTLAQYWDLEYLPKQDISPEEAIEQSMHHLDEATRIRLMSEVPLGCFLSGGIDSSLVATMMRRHVTGDLRTFSIGFREEKFNELPYARQVADLLGTRHEEFVVEPDALSVIGKLAWHFDEPFADSSALPTWYLSEMTRRHVTVALNGDGGDESFAGYERYRLMPRWQAYGRVPRPLRHLARGALAAATTAGLGGNQLRRAAHLNKLSLESADRQYVHFLTYFTTYHKQQLYTPQFLRQFSPSELDSENMTAWIADEFDMPDPVDRRMKMDILTYLPGALLPKVDRMTMAHSLEGRSPFLDHRLMEFAATLPADMKLRDGQLKWILKQAGLKFFSAEFLNRPKQGFGVPLADWFRGELREFTRETLLSEQALGRGWFRRDYIEKLLTEHELSRQGHEYRIWALLMLEVWAKTFVDRTNLLAGPIVI
jgi:asparagine synthase (glutamine-hydrolysing)